ncbi:ependymin [Brienomyrus brachyistius]|uniref:ependymin n=1 Tax=Brienomyrus brachyistius TaxID=42636 RepID=UPI0020B28BAD|nr:ependymin [Brienomyrus brachyistius]
MQALSLLAVCLCLVAVMTEKPHPCKSPPLMVGRLTVVYPEGKFVAYERFSYDALGRQIRVRAVTVDHNQTSFVDVLLLFREGVSYEISYQNQTCKKAPLKTPFPPIEIPHDAQLQGEVVLGSSSAPGMGVLVNDWVGAVPEQKAKYQLIFTEFGCLPITSINHIEDVGLILTSFYDLVIGIEDPDEFIPPPFCDKAELQQTESRKVKDFLRFFI